MLGAFVASTPLVEESWRLCSRANAEARRSFAVKVVGRVSYIAFSGVQAVASCQRGLMELDPKVFGSFAEGKGAVMVDAVLLQLFHSLYGCCHFQQQMGEMMKESKSIVLSGQSVGGAIACLSGLWLLSHGFSSVLCITYGAPMLGNQAFSQAILQHRWDGNFCHVVAPNDLLPRAGILASVEGRLRQLDQDQGCTSATYWPFGSYMFCSDKGAVCLDNAVAVIKFLYLTMANDSSTIHQDDHLNYDNYVSKLCWEYLKRTSSSSINYESNKEAWIALALQTLGISSHQEAAAATCLAMGRQLGWSRNLNNGKMAILLGKINPCRAELEWYMKYCHDCGDELGYYDSYKRRGASRREFRVSMNRLKLGHFWDHLIEKLETNQLTRDFHKLPKYVNASNYYRLLVEPLEIAEYYRTGKHMEKGHYIEHGREKRFKIFENWWGEREFRDEEKKPRSKYANLTQDSCFWARVEEAICLIYDLVREKDAGRVWMLVEEIERFDKYASGMVERMEISVDVMAKNSSYNLFRQQWRELKVQMESREWLISRLA